MVKNNNNENNIIKIKNYFSYLKLGELNSQLERFVEENIKYFIGENIKDTDVQIIDKQGFILNRKGSTFTLKFCPNYVVPSSVVATLENLQSHHQHSYVVNFANENYDTVNIIERKRIKGFKQKGNDNGSTIKRYINSVFIDGKKRFNRKFESYIGSKLDDSYSRETKIYYSNLDDSYVCSENIVAEPEACVQTKSLYQKYDGETLTPISAKEFNSEVNKFVQEKAKVFKIGKKDN